MTTITTGTSGPKAWQMLAAGAAVGLAAIVLVNLPQTSNTTVEPVAAATATLPESVTGFEYNNESTSGRVSSPGVTTQYLGNSGELFPYENGSSPAQAPTGFGGPTPQAVPDQATIDAQAPVITQEFLDGPSSATQGVNPVDPRTAVEAGLDPSATHTVALGTTGAGTTRVASPPDNIADAQDRAAAVAFDNAPYVAYAEGMVAHSEAVLAEPNPADLKFLGGQPEAASSEVSRAPVANNQLR